MPHGVVCPIQTAGARAQPVVLVDLAELYTVLGWGLVAVDGLPLAGLGIAEDEAPEGLFVRAYGDAVIQERAVRSGVLDVVLALSEQEECGTAPRVVGIRRGLTFAVIGGTAAAIA